MRHIPVLTKEVLEGLKLSSDSAVVDCTLGDAGHSEAILDQSAPNGTVLGIDADPEAVLRARKFLVPYGDRVMLSCSSFGELKKVCKKNNFAPDAILFDLGWSTPQFTERGRGFSFAVDEPLDMRYSPQNGQSAAQIIEESDEKELERILRIFGEEEKARQIAQALKAKTVTRTTDVVKAVESVYKRRGKIHPATKTFQALRIAVNEELEVLRDALEQAVEIIKPKGRIAVISFHSLEDRIVKQYFKAEQSLEIITKRPVVASAEEVKNNKSSRSAKLRIAEKK